MIYRVRVVLDTDTDDVYRDIEIKSIQTLWNLHNGIKSAFCLSGDELASFYETDKNWSQDREIPLENMSDDDSVETMPDVYLNECLAKVGDRLLYVYDYLQLWTFFIEVLNIDDRDSSAKYPFTVLRNGTMPLKAPPKQFKSEKMNGFDLLEDFDNDGDYDDFNLPEMQNDLTINEE